MNAYVEENEAPHPILYIDESAADPQFARLAIPSKTAATTPAWRARSRHCDGRPRDREHDVSAARVRAGLRDGRRNVRRASGGVGRIRRGNPVELIAGVLRPLTAAVEARCLQH